MDAKRALFLFAFILLALSLGYILNKAHVLHRKIHGGKRKIPITT